MAIEAIRNLLNQSDKAIFDVKNKLKEEKDKGISKVKEQLPTQEEITSQVKSNVCSTETAGAIDKNFNNLKDKVNGIKGKLEEGIKKLQALKAKLAKITEWMGKIGDLLKLLGKIILICDIIVKVLPKALNFLSGLAANGGIQKRISDLIDKAKSKVENFKASITSFTKAVLSITAAASIPGLLIDAAIVALQKIINIISTLMNTLEQLYLGYLAACNLPADPPINSDGNLNLGLIIEGLEQNNKTEIIEKIYNANFETIGYRRYKA